MKRLAVLSLLCTVVATCGGNSSPSPSSPTPSPATTPTPTTPPAPGFRVLGLFANTNFGEVTVGQTATLRSTIYNSGDSSLTVSSISVPAGYTASWRGGTVPAGVKQPLDITFAPTEVRAYNGTLTIVADQSVGSGTAPVTGVGNASFAGQTTGRIVDMQTVRDILEYNQNAPGAGRQLGYITRWEPPVRVYVDPYFDPQRPLIERAFDKYRVYAGISIAITSSDAPPRVLMRPGTDGLGGDTGAIGGRGGIDDTFGNNQAGSGIIVIRPQPFDCTPTPDDDCTGVFFHEMGHVLGIGGHIPAGVDYEGRYWSLLRTLYSLPHGTKVQDDGTWQVVLR